MLRMIGKVWLKLAVVSILPTALVIPSAAVQLIPTIQNVSENSSANTINISGVGFSANAKPSVTLGGTNLMVESFNKTTIVASLGSVASSGTYLLTVVEGFLVAV